MTAGDIFTKLSEYDKVLLTGPDAFDFSQLFELNSKFSIDIINKKSWAGNLISPGLEKLQIYGPSKDTEGPLYLRRSEAEIGITRKP